jgi:hypothetical protein
MDFIMAVAMASMPGIDETNVGIGMEMAGFPSGETFRLSALPFFNDLQSIEGEKDRYIDIHGSGG